MPELEEKNLIKLKKLLAIMDEDTLTRKEFTDSFEKVVELVLKIQKQQGEAIGRLEETYKTLLARVRDDHTSSLSDLKKQTNELFVGDQLKRMDNETKTSFGKLEKLIQGAVGNKLREADDRVSQLKPIKGDKGDVGLPGPMPTEHLQLMKDVQAELKKVKDILSNIPRGKAMGRAKVPMPRTIDLTSDQNGVARVFTLPPDTVRIFGGISSQFPFAIASSDISRSGNQITLDSTIAPRETGQTLLIFTDALFYP